MSAPSWMDRYRDLADEMRRADRAIAAATTDADRDRALETKARIEYEIAQHAAEKRA